MTELISKDIVDLQDIEKVQFLQALQADPAKYSAYIQDKSQRILAETVDTKRASFVKVSGDMMQQFTADHNSRAALDRTKDLEDAQGFILDEQAKKQGSTKYNEDLTRRQVEINNWYFENKRETLFVLQLLLLTALSVVVVLVVGAQGLITETFSNYLILFFMLVAGGTWFYRWYFTTYLRDRRYWSRRNFEEDRAGGSKNEKICLELGFDRV